MQSLRAILPVLPVGSKIADSQEFQAFHGALERLIPRFLAEKHSFWQYNSLDAFRFASAQKAGPCTVRLVGLALLISEQCWLPFAASITIAEATDTIQALELQIAEDDEQGQPPAHIHYHAADKPLHKLARRLKQIQWKYTLSFADDGWG